VFLLTYLTRNRLAMGARAT